MRCPPGCLDQLLCDHLQIKIMCHEPYLAGENWKSCIANYGRSTQWRTRQGLRDFMADIRRSSDVADLISFGSRL